ncbi:MAG TPA: hypothetical protein ENK85_06790 [Saprospiraceae bacterium]|nr:hypothetical protein [Saprospiraceae bacterium]
MSSKKQHDSTKRVKPKKNLPVWLLLLIPLVLGAMYWGWMETDAKAKRKQNQERAEAQKRLQRAVGRADACAKNPIFPEKAGLRPPFFIDLRQIDGPGLKIIEARKGGKVLQKKEWSQVGTLGPYTLDKHGVIYTAPIPFVSLLDRPPSYYNKIMKIDAESGEMTPFMSLPAAKEPTDQNPYGVVGMTYDCANHSIYVSSLAGSGTDDEVGRVFHIDLATKKILHQLEGFDALGLGVFTTKSGKKLYLGHARSPEIFSIDLDDSGGFVGKPKYEFSLAAQEGGSYDNAHRIRFLRDNVMKIKGIEFSFSLMAASDPQRNIYLFDYDAAKDAWSFREAHPQGK